MENLHKLAQYFQLQTERIMVWLYLYDQPKSVFLCVFQKPAVNSQGAACCLWTVVRGQDHFRIVKCDAPSDISGPNTVVRWILRYSAGAVCKMKFL